MALENVIAAFEAQAVWCDQMDSPFTAALMRAAAADMKAGGSVADLLRDWPGHPVADALMMRFAGALHAAALSGRDGQLAKLYPDDNPNWSIEAIWPVALAFLRRDDAWVRDFLKGPPQTNETRRSIGLLPGFLSLAKYGPLHTLEIGASAGLNLNWDGFRYETTSWSWGDKSGPRMDTDWRAPAPTDLDANLIVASRAGCDVNPLDVRNADDVLRLRAYIWADMPARLARFNSALALAKARNVHVDRADAGAWLAGKLAGELPEGVTVIYHSVVYQYLPEQTRATMRAAMESAVARATPTRRLAYLRFEPGMILNIGGQADHMGVDLQTWPGGERRLLVRTDGHARFFTPP